MAEDISTWWGNIPKITKWLFAGSMALTVIPNLAPSIINPMKLILSLPAIYQHFELWRIVTPFFFHGKLGFPFLMHMVFLYQYSRSLEETVFQGRPADYIFFLTFCGTLLFVVAGIFLGFMLLGMGLIMSVIYLWARKNWDQVVTFYFGIRFKAAYLPWVMIGFSLLLGGYPLIELIGVLIAHVYFYLEDVYPLASGRRLLHTPQFLRNWFPGDYPRPGGAGPAQAQQPGRHQWGTGRALGGH